VRAVLPDPVFPHVEVLAMPYVFLRHVPHVSLDALRVLITDGTIYQTDLLVLFLSLSLSLNSLSDISPSSSRGSFSIL
jgi:hypothetical protein